MAPTKKIWRPKANQPQAKVIPIVEVQDVLPTRVNHSDGMGECVTAHG